MASRRAGWRECCDRLPAKDQASPAAWRWSRHGPWRFRHRSLGWPWLNPVQMIPLVEQRDWWIVLDDSGRLVEAANGGFASPEDALEFAEL